VEVTHAQPNFSRGGRFVRLPEGRGFNPALPIRREEPVVALAAMNSRNFALYQGMPSGVPLEFVHFGVTAKYPLTTALARLREIGVGRVGLATPPPSEPDGRISRIRLSSRWLDLQEE